MVRIILQLVVCFLPFLAVAQQKPQYSQYMMNNFLLNPAIAGIEDYTDVKLGSRYQWAGIEGAPMTVYVSAHTNLSNSGKRMPSSSSSPSFSGLAKRGENRSYDRNRHGVGVVVLHDEIGPYKRTEASLSYAYHIPLTSKVKLSAGLSAGFFQQVLSGDELEFEDPADITAGGWRSFKPNLSTGLWLYSSNFYVGASGTQLLGQAFSSTNESNGSYAAQKHYFLTGAYKYDITSKLAILPSVMVKWTQPMPVSIDYNLRLVYLDRFWTGASFRSDKSVALLAGLSLNQLFDFGYSYDFGGSSLSRESGGSHEVILSIKLFNEHRVLCPQSLW
ncbi:PorP/SprF family type IX secretion system membrane protein [Pontibacter harenae]|uniref:PorP/SprF family type IX secretion system membrane protein n=1 Tax=Pontibacter harenae TaxID=2894083 RepID=UPI001E64C862|nr:type IX secretion system membrane protein PorP/SprF [Pontibacter harenae]MCC9166219.1 type IX secretion system membrane protein PorP/SprF [Pontibacter harenae]